MISRRKPYKTYTREFKIEAVRLMAESDRPSSELSAELGIRRNQLYKWKEQLENKGDKAFPTKQGRPLKENQSEVVRVNRARSISCNFSCYPKIMTRPIRIEFSGALYHVTSRGDRRESIYEDDTDRACFLNICGQVIENFNWICHAYCLIDD